MAGIVLTADGRDWGVSSAVFYWAVDALAARAQHPDLAARLREISQYNLGSLNVGSLPDAEQQDLTTAVRDPPAIARAELQGQVLGRNRGIGDSTVLPSSTLVP